MFQNLTFIFYSVLGLKHSLWHPICCHGNDCNDRFNTVDSLEETVLGVELGGKKNVNVEFKYVSFGISNCDQNGYWLKGEWLRIKCVHKVLSL